MVSNDLRGGLVVTMKILVTGGTGMVGSAFKKLRKNHEMILVGTADYDLRRASDCKSMIAENQPDGIVHLAAKVGGVKGNSDYVADFFHENILINANLLNAAKDQRIQKVVSLLSTCVYPDNPTYPLTEDQIHSGEPHQSNFGYAYAKRMLEVQSRAIRQQYGLNYVTAVPNNLYGINDNFDLINGHVIPAIVRKVHNSILDGKPPRFWGTGSAVREFTYADDIAKALVWMLESYNSPIPLNIGNTNQISIYDLVLKIQNIMGARQSSVWDDTMPSGQYKKPSSNERLLRLNPDFKYTDLDTGLTKMIGWYEKEYPNVRGF